MDKMIAEFLSIALLGAFLFVVFFIGSIIKKEIQKRFGDDFFTKNNDIIRKSVIAIAVSLCVIGFIIGFLF